MWARELMESVSLSFVPPQNFVVYIYFSVALCILVLSHFFRLYDAYRQEWIF